MFEGKVPTVRYLEVSTHFENDEQLFVLRDPSGISDATLIVSPDLVDILNLFDGEKTLGEIQEIINLNESARIEMEQLQEIYKLFNEAYFFNNKTFTDYRKKVLSDFNQKKTRDSIIVSDGLPGSLEKLHEFFNHLKDAPPPEDFESEIIEPDKEIKGLLLPHIDYFRGGQTYGRTYKLLEDSLSSVKEPLLFVIIGVAHSGIMYPISLTPKNFVSPFGEVQTNSKVLKHIEKKLGNWIYEEEWVHKNEHSIELQVLWLQHILKKRDFSILPVLTGHFDPNGTTWSKYIPSIEEIIKTLNDSLKKFNGRIIVISSIDFAHVGMNFGDDQLIDDKVKLKIEKADNKSLKNITECDASSWWKEIDIDGNVRRVCGHYANFIALNLLQGCRGHVIDYDQAVAEDNSQLVSFASAIFQ